MESKKVLVYKNIANTTESKYKETMKSMFNSPSKYLEIRDHIIIGKKMTGPKYDDKNKVIPFTYVGPKEAIQLETPIETTIPKIRPTSKIIFETVKRKPALNFEKISGKKLNTFFEDLINRINTCRETSSNFYKQNKKIKTHTTRRFQIQENNLNFQQKDRVESARLSKRISSAIKRKEDTLLMNKIDVYRMKKQMTDIIDKKIRGNEKYGEFTWYVNLRKPKNFKKPKLTYINKGTEHKPIWEVVNDHPDKFIEIIQKPNSENFKELKNFIKSEYFRDKVEKKKLLDFDIINGGCNINIKGENLLKIEMKEFDFIAKIKKLNDVENIILYTDPMLKNGQKSIVFEEDYNERNVIRNHLKIK